MNGPDSTDEQRCRPPSAYCTMNVREPPVRSRRPNPGTSSLKRIAFFSRAVGGTSSWQLAAANLRPSPRRPSVEAYDSLFHRGVKNAVNLYDIIIEQPLDLDHRAGWIWRPALQLRLHLVHHGREAV
jgi:hypothetical protein